MSHRSVGFAVALVTGGTFLTAPGAGATSGAVVRVEVSTFKNDKGSLRCGLYDSPGAFPGGAGTGVTSPLSGSSGSCKFEAVRPGTYAVAVFHDENGNGKLDKNLFGIPSEGYGISNNHHHALSGPTWDEAKFTVKDGEVKVLSVTLRY